MASPASRHLSRIWRSVPLLSLQQGSTLSIRSRLLQPTHVILKPEWRDTGHAELQQVIGDKTVELTDLVVEQQEDLETSIGRMASHVQLTLQPSQSLPTDTEQHDDKLLTVPHSPSKPIDKVILDDGTILPDSDAFSPPPIGQRRVDYSDGVAHVTKDYGSEQQQPAGTVLSVQIPEKLNVVCELPSGGSITVTGKVEGDVRLVGGDISVTKLRGHNVHLESKGLIHVRDLIEAQKVSLKTNGRVRAKQIHGTLIDVSVLPTTHEPSIPPQVVEEDDDEGSVVDISSMYIAGNGGATISVANAAYQPQRRAVRVKSSHGPLRVSTQAMPPVETNPHTHDRYPLVELGGVNGNVEVDIDGSDETCIASDEQWRSCLVHVDSLSPDSVSLVTARQGDVSITLDRKVEADLRLLSIVGAEKETLTELGATLAEEEESEQVIDALRRLPEERPSETDERRIAIKTNAFTKRPHALTTQNFEYMDGWVENKSAEPDSRFEQKVRGETGGSVGKIRLDGAADQALHGFSKAENEEPEYLRPLMAVACTNRIVVESVSWLGAIARRYGLDESDRDLGRTATRRGRPLAPKNE